VRCFRSLAGWLGAASPPIDETRGGGAHLWDGILDTLMPFEVNARVEDAMTQPTKSAIAQRYRRFGANEANGLSPLYEMLSAHIAESEPVLTFLATLPVDRQQPNLFFAALRVVARCPVHPDELDEIVVSHASDIAAVMRSRTTQTNEAGRCAVLLPALARLQQPLAIIEVGASAGLCLLPDLYGYDYGRCRLEPPTSTHDIAPIFPCIANEATPLPTVLPTIGWRLGLDLNPLSVTSAQDMEWLAALVWPEQSGRLDRLRAAAVAQKSLPRVERGDALRDLPSIIAAVPKGMTAVVFHSAVLAYVRSQSNRDAFARMVMESGATWISNEAPGVFPAIAAKASHTNRQDRFLLAINGKPLAWTGPHGQSIDWFDG
jgi:hypothetical protein